MLEKCLCEKLGKPCQKDYCSSSQAHSMTVLEDKGSDTNYKVPFMSPREVYVVCHFSQSSKARSFWLIFLTGYFFLCRFSAKRKSHGWCDFVQGSNILETGAGFAVNDSILVTADILVLSETTQFSRENELAATVSNATSEVLSGKFTWKVRFYGLSSILSHV